MPTASNSLDISSAGLVNFDGTSVFSAITYTPITSWTPTMSIGGSSSGITYSLQSGYYQVVGTVVSFKASLIINSKGSNTGAVLILGLPVTSVNDGLDAYNIMVCYGVTPTSGYVDFVCGVLPNSTNIAPYELETGVAITQLTNANVVNGSQFFMTGTYFA
jgi:hypothetical protein